MVRMEGVAEVDRFAGVEEPVVVRELSDEQVQLRAFPSTNCFRSLQADRSVSTSSLAQMVADHIQNQLWQMLHVQCTLYMPDYSSDWSGADRIIRCMNEGA